MPLVQRAERLWTELEREVGERLFVRTGGLMIGPEGGELVRGALASAEQHALPHELLTSAEVRSRFPALAPERDAVALLEPRAGVLFPEACVRALLRCAARDGAELRTGEPILTWRVQEGMVRVATAMGEHVAERLVIALGPWLPEFLNGAQIQLQIERQMQHWFMPRARPEEFSPENLPIALWETSARMFYTIPDFGDGVKIAVHHDGEITDPQRVRRTITEQEDAGARALVERFLPDAGGELRDRAACLYTNTTDGHFVIDRHPMHREVVIASPCSGHGFKFATVIGEIVAELTADRPVEGVSLFRCRS